MARPRSTDPRRTITVSVPTSLYERALKEADGGSITLSAVVKMSLSEFLMRREQERNVE